MHMYHIVICGPSGCTIFFQIISQTARFSKKKVIESKMCVLIFSTNLFETFLILRGTERDVTKKYFHEKRPLFLSHLNEP